MADLHPLRRHWLLEPETTFLNHGSFGATPIPVLEAQSRWREQMERQPVRFLARELDGLLAAARLKLAEFIGADAEGVAFVTNATMGVNTVLRSLRFEPGDELLVTNQSYNACANAVRYVAQQWGAKVVVANVPFPVERPAQVVEAITSAASPRTRLALIDHVTSPTGIVWPVAELVRSLQSRGVDVLVDGAHAPGMVPLNLRELGAAYYTGNCHKWLCAPKGAAFLHVREDRRDRIRPLIISHGANSPRTDITKFRVEFDWTGTSDPTALLCLPDVLKFMGSLFPGGWPELMKRNRDGALEARRILCDALKTPAPCPDEMIGSLAAVRLPDATQPARAPLFIDPLQERLSDAHHIEVPIVPWPAHPKRWVRISSQAYNTRAEYEQLATALQRELSGR